MVSKIMMRGLLAAALVASAVSAQADVFNMPSGSTSLSFVSVGDPNNPPDTTVMTDNTTGYGSVSYVYQMGKYDVTMAQYTQFLNAVAKSDPYGLYNWRIANGDGQFPFGVTQSGSPGSYSYSVTGSNPQAGNMPITCETWGDAARFCNWLDNGQPTAPEGNGTTETGAYTLNGGTSNAALMAVTRNADAKYVIPTENEWYKAAYYDPTLNGGAGGYWTYPTKSNTAPINTLPDTGNHANFYDYFGTGNGGYTDATDYLTPVGDFILSPSADGCFDMGGDVSQWNEADFSGSFRGLRGGAWDYASSNFMASSTRSDAPGEPAQP